MKERFNAFLKEILLYWQETFISGTTDLFKPLQIIPLYTNSMQESP
jgi:hypothetical protein